MYIAKYAKQMYSQYVPNKLLIAHKSRLLFTNNDDSIREEMTEGFWLVGL